MANPFQKKKKISFVIFQIEVFVFPLLMRAFIIKGLDKLPVFLPICVCLLITFVIVIAFTSLIFLNLLIHLQIVLSHCPPPPNLWEHHLGIP